MSSAANVSGVIRRLRSQHDASSDPELLDRYTSERDQAAFVQLVERYGALVLGVARRQLADQQRAEDVFQATFLALARSAAKLGRRACLANWLYTVALRQARKARGRAARHEAIEHSGYLPNPSIDPLDEITGRELLQVIDDELGRLPDRLRLPVLLCCVQGLSREEVARRLGWSDGAVKGRLERGRRKLAARLTARGLAPSAMLLAPLAAVSVPNELIARTIGLSASPWSQSVPEVLAALAATGTQRSLLPALTLAGCVLACVVVMVLAMGGTNPVDSVPAVPVGALTPIREADPAPEDPLPGGAILRFGTPHYRHPTAIESMAVSTDGKLALVNSGGRIHGALRAYDLATGRVLLTFPREPGEREADGVAISPDCTTMAIKRNFAVHIHDAGTGKETVKIAYPSANPSTSTDLLIFSPDGKYVVVVAAEGKALHLLGLAKGEVIRTFTHANIVFAASFSPDGKNLVGGGYDSENNVYFARVWEVETGKELRRLPFGNGGIRSITFSSDGASVAIGGDGGNPVAVKLFDAATGKERLRIPFPDASRVRTVAFSPDGKTLAASGGSATRQFDTTTGKERLKIDLATIGLRFSPDGATLVGAVAGTVYRWDATSGKSLIPEGGDSPIAQIEVTGDSKRIITRGQDGDAHVWDARTDEHLCRVSVTWQRGLALSPDGKYLVWPAADETVQFKDADQPNAIHTGSRLRMLDLTTGKLIERFSGFEGDAHDLFFSSGGKTLVTVDHRDAMVRFWDVANGKVERSFRAGSKERQNNVWHSRLSPDGKVLAVTYQPDGRGFFSPFAVKLWDTATGKQLHDLPGHFYYVEAMAFSSDGKYLVTGSDALSDFAQKQLLLPVGQVFVWEVATGKSVAQLQIGGTAGAFAPDGKTLAVAEQDGTIKFWDTAKWTVKSEFRGPRDHVTTLAFGSDGQLFSGSVDATALAWDPRAAKHLPAERK